MEFLVQNQFLRTRHPIKGWETRVLLAEPIALAHGKSVNAILQASMKYWKWLRGMGHRGCVVEHFVWDRAGISALERGVRQMCKQRSSLVLPDIPAHLSAELLALTEFVVVTPCAMHDAHNAFRWGFLEEVKNRELMRDVYVSVESIRNSMDLVQKHIGAWVAERVTQSGIRLSEEWVEGRRVLLHALDVDMEAQEILSDVLQLRWEGSRLVVSPAADGPGDIVGLVVTCLLACWRLKKWTESRWSIVGSASRSTVAGLTFGIPDFVDYIRRDTHSSLFYLNGYSRLDEQGRNFLVRASIASRVAEGVEAELMQDSRVAHTLPELWKAASEELSWVIGLGNEVWGPLAEVCGSTIAELKSGCIQAAHISYHFLWRRVFEPAGALPWRLVRGDIAANLRELKADDPPAEPFSNQLWQLLHQDFPIKMLVDVVDVLGQAGWTSVPAEQQHGSLAQFRKWHPDYGIQTLVSRAMLGCAARLLPKQTADERRASTLIRKLKQASQKNPSKVGGRQLFLQGLAAVALPRKAAWVLWVSREHVFDCQGLVCSACDALGAAIHRETGGVGAEGTPRRC